MAKLIVEKPVPMGIPKARAVGIRDVGVELKLTRSAVLPVGLQQPDSPLVDARLDR